MSGYLEGVLALLSLNIILAYAAFLPLSAGQLNLGLAGFMALGAYTSGYLSNSGLSPLYSIPAAAVVAVVVSSVVGFAILRTRGIYLALATFALGNFIPAVFLNIASLGGAAGYPVSAPISAHAIAAIALVTIAGCAYLLSTRYGLSIRAVRHDEPMSEVFGVDVRLVQASMFAASAMLAALAGALYSHFYSFISPQNFSVLSGIYVVLYVLMGGTRNVLGPLCGASVFTLLPELLRGSAEWRYVIFAVLILGCMLFRPEGIVSERFPKWSFRTMLVRR